MIHVCTVHHRTARWVVPQLDSLRANLEEPYRVWAVADGIDAGAFDRVVETEITQHAPRLNLLGQVVAAETDDDDLIVFLDSDALLIADPIPTVRAALASGHVLVAARRDEGVGTPWPHPLFCATTVGWWREHGDWRAGPKFPCRSGIEWTDAGARLLATLNMLGAAWLPVLRSNHTNPHPLFFGVYGGLVYHHGAGSRRPISKIDVMDGGDMDEVERRNRDIGDRLYERLLVDRDFWRELA